VVEVDSLVVRIGVFLESGGPELAQCTVVAVVGDGGDDDPALPRCSCWSLLQWMSSRREVQCRGLRDILEVLLEQIHRRHSTGVLVGAGAAAAGVAGLAPC
jgi:hypothetical protein